MTGRGGTGASQAEAAVLLGVDPGLYSSAEKDQCPVRDVVGVLEHAYARGPQGVPTTGELCALARRRSGMRLTDVESELGMSRPTYLAAEAGGRAEVVAFWRERGYRFDRGE